ncbi:thioesterase [candidate division KSB1 bacterium]|nr:thioesterase [candidate division KSB1 bacterium]NIR73180.1 thioesterase [candidate division KSB1 bacterium]NIS26950.1 thioesterase [candidate division KSB1 bacterium]NIT73788.1 thioesterase [candidate division KSB1 bacterium]NIU27694.1 thioesterase [candidate division KSB1 bacterium]
MARAKLKLPKKFTFTTEMDVRVSDVNYAGHLSNDKVLSFIHEARARYLQKFGYSEMDVAGRGTIMTDAVILYKSEGFHGDKLTIDVTPADFHKYGCDFYYRLINKKTGHEIARAKTAMVFYDYETRKMIQAPEEFVQLCAPVTVDSGSGSRQ